MPNSRGQKLTVVGSGFFGAVIARVAADDGHDVLVLDRRGHVGGNAYSYFDQETGIEVHKYGSHLFHTSNVRVWNFLRSFTSFNDYRHHVYTNYGGQVFSMPINLHTISQFYGKALSPQEAEIVLANNGRSNEAGRVDSLESKAITSVGRGLYEALIRGYTLKQWGRDPKDLPAATISRLPVRMSYNSRYFSDRWEGLPTVGYGELFQRILDHPRVEVVLNTDFFDVRNDLPRGGPIVYTGPLDQFFGFRYGRLGWRTLDFEFKTLPLADFQGTSVMNFADSGVPFTRIHEFKHLHPERPQSAEKTVVAMEYSREARKADEPYYPVNSPEDRTKFERYKLLSRGEHSIFFGGRLGSYKYLDMHMAVASALTAYENKLQRILS